MGTKLYVGNLSFRTTSEELRDAFAAAGTVESASVIEDRDTGRIIPSVFEPPQTIHDHGNCFPTANVADYSAHSVSS